MVLLCELETLPINHEGKKNITSTFWPPRHRRAEWQAKLLITGRAGIDLYFEDFLFLESKVMAVECMRSLQAEQNGFGRKRVGSLVLLGAPALFLEGCLGDVRIH